MHARIRTIALLACAAAALSFTASAQAATFEITTTEDESDANCQGNDCSIREALTAASANGDGKDKITIPKGGYRLELGPLEVTTAVKLAGAGAQRTVIDADGFRRPIDVSGGPTTISKLMVTGGNSLVADGGDFPGDAGGILAVSAAPLTLSKVAIVDNQAQMGGGGLAAPIESMMATELRIKDSTIARNEVTGGTGDGMGGGLAVAGDLSLTNTTVAMNRVENMVATNRGGGISVMSNTDAGEGSGITTLSLKSATIAKNVIGGEAMDGLGGGIGLSDPVMGATVNIDARNSIVSQNRVVGSVENCGMVTTGVTSKANLSSDETCLFDDNKSITGKNAKLGRLSLSGGQTQTMRPKVKAPSPVVDAGVDNGCPNRDQRGVKRPQGKRCDIGAVEVEK